MIANPGHSLIEDAGLTPRKQRDLRVTLDRILTAAEIEFANLGLEGVRMQDVARRAHVSRQTVYTYFPDKLSLFQEMYRRFMQRNGEMLFSVEFETMAPVEALVAYVECQFRTYTDHGHLAVESWHCDEAVQIERLTPDITARAVKVLDGILKRGQSAGLFRSDIDSETVFCRSNAVCLGSISSAGLMSRIFMNDHHSGVAMTSWRDFCVQSILNLTMRHTGAALSRHQEKA
jgi:AcrR family transcriptional regulator